MSRIHAALLGGAMGLTSMSCVNRESPPLDHEGTVASHEEPLSGQGMEALIPLRLVNVLPCAPGPSCPDNADYHSVLRSVDAANEVFKAVGVQFWAKSVERYHMPSFADLRYQSCGGTGDVRVPWSQVRAQLKQVLPSMSDAAWPEGEMKTPAWWLRAVNTAEAAASNPEEFGEPRGGKLLLWLSILDLIRYWSITFKRKSKGNKVLICDRYFWDTFIDFKLRYPQIKFENWLSWKILEKVYQKPNCAFCLTVTPEESMRRSSLKFEPFPETEEKRKQRLNEYLKCIDDGRWEHIIDCMCDIDSIQKEIVSIVDKLLEKKTKQ